MHYHTQDIAWTGQHSVCPDCVLETESFFLLPTGATHILAHEFVNLISRRVSQYKVSIVVDQMFLALLLRERYGFSQFPVRLTVQLVRLDEHGATLLCRLEQNQVGRNALSLHNLNDLSHFDVFRSNGLDFTQALWLALQVGILSVIELFVASEARKVIPAFLYHCHKEYESKRSDICEEKTDFEEWHELANSDDQEEHVEEELEFVVENFEDESENIVLLIV